MTTAFVFIVLFLSNYAKADLKVFEENSENATQLIFSSQDPQIEGFFDNQEKFKIFGALFNMKNLKEKNLELTYKDNGLDLVSDKDRSYVIIGTEKGRMEFKTSDGQIKKYVFQWQPISSKIIYNRCGKGAPKLQNENLNNPSPLLIGLSCRIENKSLFLTVSSLSSTEWLETTMFESAGKGERWRDYQVPGWTANGGTIAEFKFNSAGQIYKFQYVAPQSEEAKKKDEITKEKKSINQNFENSILFGQSSLGLDADTINATDSQLLLGYNFLSPRFLNQFRFGGFFSTTLQTTQKDEALSFLETFIHADYIYSINEVVDASIGVGYQYADFQQKSSAARMQNSQPGVILGIDYLLTSENRLSLQLYKSTFSSPTIKNNLSYQFDYKRKLEIMNQQIWLGVFFKSQSFDAVNNSGSSRQFKENPMGLSLSF